MIVKKKKRVEAVVPTSSMADIAFLLLVFFLLVTTISSDKGIIIPLPPIGDEIKIRSQNITNIFINDQGRIMFDDEEIQITLMKDRIFAMVQENPLMIFSIKSTKGADYQVYISVIDQLKVGGATKISLAEPEG